MKSSDAVILVEPKPRGAATWRAAGATCADGKLTVKVVDGADVEVPPNAVIYVNGCLRLPDAVPEWFAGMAAHRKKVAAEDEKFVPQGFRRREVPGVHFTLADTDEGTVARFDQRAAG